MVGWVGCLQSSSCGPPWGERFLKMLTGVFLKTHSRKRAQPHYQSASGTLSAASIRWALKRVRQGPSPVPAPGWGRTVAGNPGCPGGCQRLSALPRRSAACRCVPVMKGSLSAPLSAEESSLHPQFHFQPSSQSHGITESFGLEMPLRSPSPAVPRPALTHIPKCPIHMAPTPLQDSSLPLPCRLWPAGSAGPGWWHSWN